MQSTDIFTILVDPYGVWGVVYFLLIAFGVIVCVKDQPWPIPTRVLLIYALLYSLFLFEFPARHFANLTRAYQYTAAQAFVETIVIVYLATKQSKVIELCIAPFALISCLAVWTHTTGLLNAPSFNSAFAALLMPFVPLWVALIILATVLAHHGSTALLILGAQLLSIAIRKHKFRPYFAGILILLFGIAYLHHNGPLLDGLERLQKYGEYFDFWSQSNTWVFFGAGPGTFMWTSIMMSHFKPPLFLQMHSDWLQIIWELGMVGFFLALFTVNQAIDMNQNRPRIFAGILGVIAFGMTYHPLRFAPTALICAWIFYKAFNGETQDLGIYGLQGLKEKMVTQFKKLSHHIINCKSDSFPIRQPTNLKHQA